MHISLGCFLKGIDFLNRCGNNKQAWMGLITNITEFYINILTYLALIIV